MARNVGSIYAEMKAKTTDFVSSMKPAIKSMDDAKVSGSSLDSVISKGLGFISVAGIVAGFTSEIKKSLTAASEYETSMLGLTSVAGAFGVASDDAKNAANSLASDGLLPVKDAGEGLKNLLATGFNLEEATNLMDAFKDSASLNRKTTMSLSDQIVTATEGIKNQNSILVDNAGITKNLSNILKDQGASVSDLSNVTSDASIRQKLYNGILKEAAIFSGGAEKAANTYQGRLAQLNTAVFNLRREIGAQLLPVLASFIGDANDSANAATSAASSTDKFGRSAYVAGNLIKGLVLFISSLGKGLGGVAAVIINTSKIIYSFAKDAMNNIKSVGRVLFDFGHLMHGAFTMNLDEIKTAFGNMQKSGFTSFTSTLQTAASEMKFISEDITNTFNAAMAAFGEAFKQDDFVTLTDDFTAAADGMGSSTTNAADKAKNASEKIKDALDDTKDASELAKKAISTLDSTIGDLQSRAQDLFDTFKQRKNDVKDSISTMKDSLKDLRKELKQIKKDSNTAMDDLRDAFSLDVSEAQGSLGENIADALIDIESTISDSNASILELQATYAAKSVEVEADRLAEIAELNAQRDYTEFEKDAAEEVARVRNSINDYATAAELAEAEERVAATEAEKQAKIDALDAEIDAEIAAVNAAADAEIATAKSQADEEIAILQAQVTSEQAILTQHQTTFAAFADAITEGRRVAAADSITLLLEGFATEKTILEDKLATDLEAERTAKKTALQEAKKAFADEYELNIEALDNLKKFWKKKENAFQNHLDRIKEKRTNAYSKLAEEYEAAIGQLNTATAGAIAGETGGTDVGVTQGNGKASISIGEINVTGDADVNALIDRLSSLLVATTA